ncbi:unnamed protein product [Nippostrongylus brasiliensis]|uniref:Uncharacterized protein n=1 Tax=Nippostrongylus brasiliensis TaxID=27835 RepID=A0A0N4XMD1_NIPBR|nr:unnamed protein product [Nippostrongylus brasiliensis]
MHVGRKNNATIFIASIVLSMDCRRNEGGTPGLARVAYLKIVRERRSYAVLKF